MTWNRHIHSDERTAICFMAHSDGKFPRRDEANARLIAAAPELLAALRRLVQSGKYAKWPDWEAALQAIDKATGSAA